MKRVLFVDDSEETRDLVHMIFATEDGEVSLDYADNSVEAIKLFNANNYNACVLDVSLPDITGYYLGKLIREACPNMPIAFLTNYEGNFTKENAEYIQAEFWAKAEVFAHPLQLKSLVIGLALEEACESHDTIETPELIKELT